MYLVSSLHVGPYPSWASDEPCPVNVRRPIISKFPTTARIHITLFVLLAGGHQPQRPRGGERRGVPGHLRLRVRPRVDLRVPRLPHLPVERQVRKSW